MIFLTLFTLCLVQCSFSRPNIVMIIADDLGWNDVGFHGSNQIPTPNIDALAYSGVILQNYYVTPICTPSRAALMTGKYPIHTGMQHGVIYGTERRGLPLSERILPQYLKDLGFSTHLVGKWHLGSYKKEYLPLHRGFDSHLGFWTGRIDMYDHTSVEKNTWGFDFRRDYEVAHDYFGQYVTDIYTKEAVKVINNHDRSKPLFLMVAHSAVHSGNPYEPIRAPDDLVNHFDYIQDFQRRKFAAVLSKLDESVGVVVAALKKQGLLNDSIIIFSTDNGGPAGGFNDNAASNFPLKGVKNTLWEGGIRAAGFLWSPLLARRSRVSNQMMHITDWLPTLYSAAGGNISVFENIDGIDQWSALSQDHPSSRNSILHNIDYAYDGTYGSASMMVNQWKVLDGSNYKGKWDNWYGPDGREGSYNVTQLYQSIVAPALEALNAMPTEEVINRLRTEATLTCNTNITEIKCEPMSSPCLFDIIEDPCERRNLANSKNEALKMMLQHLKNEENTAMKPLPSPIDECGDPKYWGRVFTNFGDYEKAPNISRTLVVN